jgi:arylsulfatase A-like enzyme
VPPTPPTDPAAAPGRRPNILLVVSDQERQRGWLPPSVRLPWRERLMAEGIEFTRYFTHSSPCSPSRASLLTGQYLPGHGVIDNVIMPEHKELDPHTPTIGSLLRGAGYRSSYIGKWHLSQSEHPDMEAYGFSDWDGNDRHFMGWAGTGVHFDPVIASNAAQWIAANAAARPGVDHEPWFLTVALVNPHDVMWFPIDQPGYEQRNPADVASVRRVLEAAAWKDDDPLPIYTKDYDEVIEELPANFHDDLHTKPEAHRQWRWDQQHGLWGYIDPGDTKAWLRHLDYYVELQRLADESLGTVLGALEDAGAWDDTIVIFTSDHGDMCGSHGLRSKGPFVYDEIMRVPLYMRVPGLTTAGSITEALATHVDLAATICALAGVDRAATTGAAGEGLGLQGIDFSSVLASPSTSVRDHVLFAQDSAQTQHLNQVRYALRGFFDGTTKYARYYGVGGGKPSTGLWGRDPGHKLFGVDSDFDDQDHEWYDHDADPLELVNLANDRSRREELRALFERLRHYEAQEMVSAL